jgi:hypothetical protein
VRRCGRETLRSLEQPLLLRLVPQVPLQLGRLQLGRLQLEQLRLGQLRPGQLRLGRQALLEQPGRRVQGNSGRGVNVLW